MPLWVMLLFPAAVVTATLAGGAVPLRLDRHARLLLCFSAGTLVALALLELIPDGIGAFAGERRTLLLVLAAFLATMALDKLHVLHPHSHAMDASCPPERHAHAPLAMHGAIGLLLHSAVDGLALAAALRQSPGTALAVALALSTHKFADGITTVSLVLSHNHGRRQAVRLLAGNASLFLVGLGAGLLLKLEAASVGALLLALAGFFLYLGASDLIPSLTTPVCRKRDVLATACGMAVIALVTVLAR
jgi:ZIP family zinc transporter